jgi:hypothetical protein
MYICIYLYVLNIIGNQIKMSNQDFWSRKIFDFSEPNVVKLRNWNGSKCNKI